MAITDEAVWLAEERLWLEGGSAYSELVAGEALLVMPGGGILTGSEASEAMADREGWQSVAMSQQALSRSDKNAIVIAYRAEAEHADDTRYAAHCTSTYHAVGGDWQLIQHQQTVID
ncbi:DUF4440 domain-containing protein [Qipengyuania atrilutea]|uniref:DUF4440 domain-containing protein n=1 Tax=Qipengyuania atrilutea TaxID=2744473 RepID=A0A850H025_9SPHN|nr:DUF4440 domain-containing protein [Actirhodobacter atriluteus]NVD43850.1 DUF4440 domain-containing protein [Actirhodobacter atriluteus]